MANGTYIPTSGAYMSDGYQQASGMALKTGRWLTAGSRRNEVMINETLAKARFGSQNPVGLGIQLQVSGDHSYEVVGVLRDVRETVRSSPGPCVYFPIFFYMTTFLSTNSRPTYGQSYFPSSGSCCSTPAATAEEARMSWWEFKRSESRFRSKIGASALKVRRFNRTNED